MKRRDQAYLDAASLDKLVEEITVDANGEDEHLWAFRQAFEDNVSLPGEATVIGEPVKVMKFDYDGNNRRGLTAMCRLANDTRSLDTAGLDRRSCNHCAISRSLDKAFGFSVSGSLRA